MTLASLTLLLSGPSLWVQAPSDSNAVVAVYAHIADDSVALGTGFFISASGDVLTCYHVVKGARSVSIVYGGKELPRVLIKSVSPEFDLAYLTLLPPVPDHPYLSLAPRLPSEPGTRELRVIGWPRGGEKSVMTGRMIASGLSNSLSLQTPKGEQIFTRRLELLLLDVSAYGGMSGAPVISTNGVIGILSGSYAEGGGIAWAIPVWNAQRQAVTQLNRAPSEVKPWPEFNLVIKDDRWNGLRGLYRRNETAAGRFRDLDRHLAVADSLFTSYHDMSRRLVAPWFDTVTKYDSLLVRALANAETSKDGERELRRFLSEDYYETFQGAAPLLAMERDARRRMMAALDTAWREEDVLMEHAGKMALRPDRSERFYSTYLAVSVRLRELDSMIASPVNALGAAVDNGKAMGEAYDSLWDSMFRDVDRRGRLDLTRIRRFVRASERYFAYTRVLADVSNNEVWSRVLHIRYQQLQKLHESMVFEIRPIYRGSY